jgi:MoaA/NifB/PqqE/SkfB family radical SAM enzyme
MNTDRLQLLSLEITGRCQLACVHCYADSGTKGTDGSMSTTDWLSVVDQAATAGARQLQLIGGEPTLHGGLTALVDRALCLGMGVEIFTNLVGVTPAMWALFERPGVRLATSYYSSDAARHDAITGRRSHDRTLAGIREALRRSIPLRVSVIQVGEDQRPAAAVAEMRALGVRRVGTDRLRGIGRGARRQRPGPAELCGRCADGKLAVLPTGDVIPCLLSRWLVLGNVGRAGVGDLYAQTRDVRSALVAATMATRRDDRCGPDDDGGVCEQPTCMPHYEE